MEVGIVTVGNELLAGDTVNTNATWLCGQLHERGVTVTRVVVVPDDVEDIAREVKALREMADAVIVTGGVGPTHDDVTLDAIARAVDRPLAEHERAKRWLAEEGGYSVGDLVPGTVDLPEGSTAIHNEVGVAPGAIVDDVFVFPGVPAEMQAMFGSVSHLFRGEQRERRTVVVDEPESHLLKRFEAMQERFDVAIGSYPGDVVKVTITGSSGPDVEEAAAWLSERAETVSAEEDTEPDERHDHA